MMAREREWERDDRQLPPSPHLHRIVEIYFGKTHGGGLSSPSFPWQQAWGDSANLGDWRCHKTASEMAMT